MRIFLLVLPFLLMLSCAKIPKQEKLSVKKSDVVILGGSITGLTVASKIKDFDTSITVSLIEKNDVVITEPFINLYISGDIDKNMVVNRYEDISKKRGYNLIQQNITRIDTKNKEIYFDDFILKYKSLTDTRYKITSSNKLNHILINNNLKNIKKAIKKLSTNEKQKILIDASNLKKDELLRAYELFLLLDRNKKFHMNIYQKDKIFIKDLISKESILYKADDFSSYGIVFLYPKYIKYKHTDNFFKQYNDGLDIVSRIIKKQTKSNFLPNLVKEDSIMITDIEKLKGFDTNTLKEIDITDFFAKIKKIKLGIM